MTSQSTSEHREQAEKHPPVCVAILTVSDTRDLDTDKSGQIIEQKLRAAGHTVLERVVHKDEPALIRQYIQTTEATGAVDAILINGGTGISPRDGTFEVVNALIEKPLPGFGELFRMLSWEEVGSASMLSRAVAGIYRSTLIFSMPGSSNAVTLAMEKLIAPELAHIVWELKRK